MFGRPGPSSGPSPRRPRSPRPSHSSSPAPSASLLSLLATVAASIPAVDGSPAPLLFLYPRYAPADEDPQQDDIPFAPALLSPLAGGSSGSSQPITRRRVPSKYEKDDNGKWRKAETYSLYGSTMCPACDKLEGSYQAADSAPTSSTSSPITETDVVGDILDTLPVGWKPHDREPKTTLIVTLSLVLAFVICFLIIGCLFWRKTIRRKYRHDIEMRSAPPRQREGPDDDEEALTDRDVRRKQKIWAKATARWKAHARARQRRGRRSVQVTSTSRFARDPDAPNNDQAPTTDDDRLSDVSDLRSSSRASSRRSPSTTRATSGPLSEADASLQDFCPPAAVICVESSAQTELSNSPPAYHTARGQSSMPQISISTSNLETQRTILLNTPLGPLSPSYDGQSRPGGHLSDSDDPIYSPSAAHVATDDKAILERLTQSTSYPPDDDGTPSQNAQESSAPTWQDEDMADFAEDPAQPSSSSGEYVPISSPITAFPSPPVPLSSKGKMSAEYYEYDYVYSPFDEDIQALEPELGPSAPPFEAVAGAPHMQEDITIPSAPTMDDNDDGMLSANNPQPPETSHPPHYQS